MSSIEKITLAADLIVPRVIIGLWQAAGGHGEINEESGTKHMIALAEAGFTAFDTCDWYGAADDMLGYARHALEAKYSDKVEQHCQLLVKWFPKMGRFATDIHYNTEVPLTRLQTKKLDLVQVHWRDYNANQGKGYLHVLKTVSEHIIQNRIKHIGAVNFDTQNLKIALEKQGQDYNIVSNQVCFSLIDTRPLTTGLVDVCKENKIHLLCYGTLLGGFLSETWMGKPEPSKSDLDALKNWSLLKYKVFIDQWGGWALFQELLQALKQVADKHRVSISNVAAKYILAQPQVAAVIIGVRVGLSDHAEDNKKIFSFLLDSTDISKLEAVVKKGKTIAGQVGEEMH